MAIDPLLAAAPHRIATVTLAVRDLGLVAAFYRETIGLEVAAEAPGRLSLGVEGAPLLHLAHDPSAQPRSPRDAGLFHTAFLLPERADLATWLGHATARGVRLQGASDHRVSEAVYLADPEGNGIEVYADRPSRTWTRGEGGFAMSSDPLDLDGLMAEGRGRAWRGAPSGTIVGHVHLQVGEIAPAEAFYRDVLGLEVTCRYPGGSFFGSGGYHHQLAANVWNSRGAAPRPAGRTGLAEVEIRAAPDALAAARGRAGHGDAEAGRLVLRDPWGTAIALVAA